MNVLLQRVPAVNQKRSAVENHSAEGTTYRVTAWYRGRPHEASLWLRGFAALCSLGYYELLKAVKNPNHKEHRQMLDWLGGKFNPGHFDLQKLNATLRRLEI